jgi:hypothetical protein
MCTFADFGSKLEFCICKSFVSYFFLFQAYFPAMYLQFGWLHWRLAGGVLRPDTVNWPAFESYECWISSQAQLGMPEK